MTKSKELNRAKDMRGCHIRVRTESESGNSQVKTSK